MHHRACIYVAGSDTLLGKALGRQLLQQRYANLVGIGSDEPDLTNPAQVEDFFAEYQPEYVFVAAGKSGGIAANQRFPADLMQHNLTTASNIIDAAHRHSVKKLLYVASCCVYPKHTPQPMRVDFLMTGKLEPTNEAYALAKLAGLKLCEAYRRQHGCHFITAIATNYFGPHDNFDPDNSHVIPGLIRRLHRAKETGATEFSVWGSGTPRREFLFVDDLALACMFVMRNYDGESPINLGNGTDISVADAAAVVADVVGFRGKLIFDRTKNDGMPYKALDATPLSKMHWQPQTDFRTAVEQTYHWFQRHAIKEDDARASRTTL